LKTVATLIQHLKSVEVFGNTQCIVDCLTLDSRAVKEGTLFFAVKGEVVDGHDFINKAIQGGAIAIVCENIPQPLNPSVCYIQVPKVAAIIGDMAASFYDYPSNEMKIIGITGTNGKTTVGTLLFQLFTKMGHTCGLVSTVANYIGEAVIPATHTTPDAISLHHLFNTMYEAGCEYVFMEVSSHAVAQNRIGGVDFDGAVFTNITHDHLDYHKTFDAYIKAKKGFFDTLKKDAFTLVNTDDKRGLVMLQNTKATKKTYALRVPADFKGKVLANELDGLQMMIDHQDVHFRLNGLFNAYNILAVYSVAINLGKSKQETLEILSELKGAVGRFETIRSSKENILGIVDYAHTPDALLNVLITIKQFSQDKDIITVIGCGGNRDVSKRPAMAEVAVTHSTKVILTSDNPRDEDPEVILDDMEKGISVVMKRKYLRITNRQEAIKTAVSMATSNSIILLAGKGHETYQEIKKIKHHFDDKEQLINMFTLLER
jgi:UDP-N-acetylmuramoyl-L-alanyl-D-glutamate--2,6-diaminopimelate ligase